MITVVLDVWSSNSATTEQFAGFTSDYEFKINHIVTLPEKYKVVLNLYLIEGYDHQEIAQILNITEVTSRSQLMRGKNKLKSKLKAYNYA